MREYWSENRGVVPTYPSDNPAHPHQEQVLSTALRTLIGIGSVLEVGCGNGRIAALLERVLPKATYTGLDISRECIAETQRVRPDAELICGAIQDLDTDRRWDLVVTSEVLMHIPPDEVESVVAKLQRLGRYIVAVEWAPLRLPKVIDPHNWPHDYRSLLRPFYDARTDEQMVYIAENP